MVVLHWPSISKVPIPNNYREVVVARQPISYWRLGDIRSLVAKDEMRYNNGEYRYAWFNGIEFKSVPKMAIYGQNHSIEINDNDSSTKFQWNQEQRYDKPEGQYLSIPHKSKYVGMSTLLIEFFFKMDRPKGHTGTILSKCDSININPAYHIEIIRDWYS